MSPMALRSLAAITAVGNRGSDSNLRAAGMPPSSVNFARDDPDLLGKTDPLHRRPVSTTTRSGHLPRAAIDMGDRVCPSPTRWMTACPMPSSSSVRTTSIIVGVLCRPTTTTGSSRPSAVNSAAGGSGPSRITA